MTHQQAYGQYTQGQITYTQYQALCNQHGWIANDPIDEIDSGGTGGSGPIRP